MRPPHAPHASPLTHSGAIVIDNSSAFRYTEGIPLVVGRVRDRVRVRVRVIHRGHPARGARDQPNPNPSPSPSPNPNPNLLTRTLTF